MAQPRIIAGRAKGQRLKSVPGNVTRPITDKVKGALFNIISYEIEDSDFLDLFGGTGSVGLEALSRGAQSAVFIELNRAVCNVLKENVTMTRFDEQAKVFRMNALKYISLDPTTQFDIIFVAPPQYKKIWLDTLVKLDENINWLDPEGMVVVQIDTLEYETVQFVHLIETDQRRYGDTLLLFFKMKKDISKGSQ